MSQKVFPWETVRNWLEALDARRAETLVYWIGALRERFGDEVLQITKKATFSRGENAGKAVAEKDKDTTIAGIVRIMTSPEFSRDYYSTKVVEADEKRAVIRFYRCPLVETWKRMGLSKEEILTIDDIVSEVDQGIVKGYNPKFSLKSTKAAGYLRDGFCQMTVTNQQ